MVNTNNFSHDPKFTYTINKMKGHRCTFLPLLYTWIKTKNMQTHVESAPSEKQWSRVVCMVSLYTQWLGKAICKTLLPSQPTVLILVHDWTSWYHFDGLIDREQFIQNGIIPWMFHGNKRHKTTNSEMYFFLRF